MIYNILRNSYPGQLLVNVTLQLQLCKQIPVALSQSAITIMPQLLDAPNKVLLQIIAYTDVEDIESFSGCKKRIRLFFGPVL